MAAFKPLWPSASIRSRIQRHLPHKSIGASRYHRPAQNTDSSDYEDFYRYTSGRWLWAEEERLQERYKKFNVAGLKQLAAEASGAQSCTSITKLAEGGFNKIFRLSMDNGSVVIARVPNSNIGPASSVIASEVATMDFARNVLEIPVPKVLAWDGGLSNIADSEYILMEQAKGTQLEELWDGMDLDDKLKIVDGLVAIQKKLQSVTFSRYGNLYFMSDSFEGCFPVEISGSLPSAAKTDAESRFTIGPVADNTFWHTGTASLPTDRGPCRIAPNNKVAQSYSSYSSGLDARHYLRAIATRERSKIPSTDVPATKCASQPDSDGLDSPQARLSLLDKFEAVSPYLPPTNADLNVASLSHWDLRAPNIFVEDGRITSLIDWQDTWVGPLFMQERRPQLIEYYGEILLRLPDHYETMKDKVEKAKLTEQVEKSILYWYYGRETQKQNPTLTRLFDLPLARRRRETVLFASELWDGEVIPLRECLYQLQRHWDKLETGVACPINFTSKEIEAHDREAAGWNEKADFWSSLDGLVSRDGYTSIHNYEKAREMFEELREQGLALFSGKELAKFAEQSKWASRSG